MTRRAERGRSPAAGRSRSTRLPESVGTITIDRIAAGGDGVGRIHGLAVFVPRTAPGDVAQIAYTTHARHGRGRVLQVLTPSTTRVPATCRHYEQDHCGGCQLQHLEAATQRQVRQAIVQETLRRIGRREVPLPPITSDLQWGYRGRLTLTLQRRGTGWIGGLHPHDQPGRVFALEECHIAHPAVVGTWLSVRGLLRAGAPALPEASSLRLALRLDEADSAADAPTVSVVIEGGAGWRDRAAWSEAVRRADARISQVLWVPENAAGVALEVGDAVGLPPAAQEAMAFAQVNVAVAEALRAFVFDAVQAMAPRQVVDAYAGTGRLAAQLVAAGVEVLAIEADPAGAEAAVRRVGAIGGPAAERAEVICDLVERVLPRLDADRRRPEVLVLNPPRRGVDGAVTRWLEDPANQSVRGVVYVSCDPGTLARDLARLPSWQVAAVQCFDMFPQTAHVETVCVLRRENP